MKKSAPSRTRIALSLAAVLYAHAASSLAGDDVKALLEILLEKGIITQQEYETKIKKAEAAEEIKAFNQAQDIRKASNDLEQRAEKERKIRTEFYGQASAGAYSANHMTSSNAVATGMSDQPKGNNRVGFKASRELDNEVTAMLTLESNFSLRTGAFGKDAGGYGYVAAGNPVFDREASIRVASKTYGTVILGRGPNLQNDLSGAFDARQNWNFGGLKPIGRYAGFHSASGINRADKQIRFISPAFNGFNFDGGVSLGGVPVDSDQGTSYYLGGRYKKDNFEVGYNHIEAKIGTGTSQVKTNNRVDFLATKYTLDKLTVNAGYVMTRNPSLDSGGSFNPSKTDGKVNADTFFTGAVYRLTPQVSVNGAWYRVQDKSLQTLTNKNNDVSMIATGLTWSPYKEWDFFIDYVRAMREAGATGAFTIFDKWIPDTGTNGAGYSESKKNQSGVSVGAQYKF